MAITYPWTALDAHVPALFDGLDRAIAQLSKDTGLLAGAAADQIDSHRASEWLCRNRLFGVAVLGSQGVDPMPAVPVGVVSTLWWAGAESLDDLADGYAAGTLDRATVAATTASIANLVVIPLEYIDNLRIDPPLKTAWRRELLWSCRLAAEGQYADTSEAGVVVREQVLAGYRGKTGAAYARDAVMAAHVLRRCAADDQAIAQWREFGMLYGILRQLHNDNTPDAPEDNEDLANHTPTLRLVHAFSASEPSEHPGLVRLRSAARTDRAARRELHDVLTSEAVTASYHRDVRAIHHEACQLLDSLGAVGRYRDVLRAGLDLATICALEPPQSDSGAESESDS